MTDATAPGARVIMTAFFSFPLYFASSACVWPSISTTGPVTLPFVPGAHAYEATMSGITCGSFITIVAVPRSQPTGISQGSSFTFSSPYSFIFSAVHLLAFSSPGEPVSRWPITSEMYSRFFMISDLLAISAISFLSSSAAAWAFGFGAASALEVEATGGGGKGR
jgi:hypothetical protein